MFRFALPQLALLGLIPLLGSCAVADRVPRQTLHVRLVPNDELDWLQADYRDAQIWEPLLAAFRKLHPDVQVQITTAAESSLPTTLQRDTDRGLGPDLLLVRATVAIALLDRSLVDPLPQVEALASAIGLLKPADRRRVSGPRGMAGLPVFNEVSLACYDRRRLTQPPTTLSELLAEAAAGRPIGLAADAVGLWWTAGALGAHNVLEPVITGHPQGVDALKDGTARLHAWLTWLRQAALQSRVDVAANQQDLTEGLETGRLAWIPCYSLTLHRLDRTMGQHLGVAPLPGGPAGGPSPFTAMRVLALGVNSSPEQRRLALELAALGLNPLVQRDITLRSRMVLPSNRFVAIPVASSGRLAALAKAESQFMNTSEYLSQPFSADQVRRVQPAIQAVLGEVMSGMQTPEEGAAALNRLAEQQP